MRLFPPMHVRTFPPEEVTSRNIDAEMDPRSVDLALDDVEEIWSSVVRLYRTRLHPAIALCVLQLACISAFEDKQLVRAEDLSQEMRWPSFSKHAVARGVRAVLASPIPYNQDAVGVVAVMSEQSRPWSAEAELGLLAFTDLAALLIATMLMGEQQTELAGQLQSALNSRAVIEQAKGILIGRQGISAHAAYQQLRAQARSERRKLAALSAELVHSAVRPSDGSS